MRWDFCRKIMENPLEVTSRLVFADWLTEQEQHSAAQRQREYAKHVANAVLLRKGPGKAKFYSLIFRTKSEGLRQMEIKPDGECMISTYNLSNVYVSSLVSSYVTYQRRKQAGIKEKTNSCELILWVKESLLLDACEAAGVAVF